MTNTTPPAPLTRKDFAAPIEVRWCPGCGDYSILNSIQKVFPELGIPKEQFVVVSGIGCSSRFPYYMNTYGFHTVHGRAPTVATGIKTANPDLSVWMITGDGDGLSIGGNHLLHVLRRNPNINILLFNNRIYGLTKGQYSPTSKEGTVKKSTPMGSIDHPINPICFALSANSTFVARTIDTNPKHMAAVFKAAAEHEGVSFVEVLQNCVIFNDKVFEDVAGKSVRDDKLLMLEHDQPLIFGKEKNLGIRFNGFSPEVVKIGENGIELKDIHTHNAFDLDSNYAYILSRMNPESFPTPMGILRSVEQRSTYEDDVDMQIEKAIAAKGQGDLQALLKGNDYWEVK